MMRLVLSIGCDKYSYLGELSGAEHDAKAIFDLLVESGAYSSKSKLLLSCTVAEYKSALADMLYSEEKVDLFTFFFAGHGITIFESFYLAFADTKPEQLPISGMNFSELARSVVSAMPRHANLILDTCNSSGLGYDLPAVLKHTLMGSAGTTGVSFLASAAADQSALEIAGEGVFSKNLARILRGDVVIQRNKRYLSMSEIGTSLMPMIRPETSQTVSFWALNVQGPDQVALNPHYDRAGAAIDEFQASVLRRTALSTQGISRLRQFGVGLDEFDESQFRVAVRQIDEELSNAESSALLYGLMEGFRPEAQSHPDTFLESRMCAVVLGYLVRNSNASPENYEMMQEVLEWMIEADTRALGLLRRQIADHSNALVDREHLFSELYFLPLRLSAILGRLGVALLCRSGPDVLEYERIARQVLNIYGNSVLAISDRQAADFLVFYVGAWSHKWTDICEEVVGRLYYDVIESYGNIAELDIESNEIWRFLSQRYKPDYSADASIYASPSDLLTVILTCASLSLLDEAVDETLILLDHKSVNYFAPEEILSFGVDERLKGTNHIYSIGHGIWTCSDVRREWSYLRDKMVFADRHSEGTEIASAASGLSFRDRVPWHILARFGPAAESQDTKFSVR
jgi:hypothetical protein